MDRDSNELVIKLKEFIGQFRIELAFITISLILILTTVVLFSRLHESEKTTAIAIKPERVERQPTKKPKMVLVHLDGAVENPDVYEVTEGARLKDVLTLANGLSKQADRAFFARNFNLAQILADQQKIYIPSVGEVLGNQPVLNQDQNSGQSALVSINSASQQGLEGLPAIGPVTAQKIISGRPFNQIEDLVSRKIIGPATFEKLKALITL